MIYHHLDALIIHSHFIAASVESISVMTTHSSMFSYSFDESTIVDPTRIQLTFGIGNAFNEELPCDGLKETFGS